MKKPQQVVILCGGIGTRLQPLTYENPKPMVLCNKKPFLWYLLNQLNEQGISDFILLTGYLGDKIKAFFGDGRRFGWQIQYSMGPINWDTGKRLWEAKKLISEQFVLLYSDNFVPFSLDEILRTHYRNNLSITLMLARKTPGNIQINESGIVEKYISNRSDVKSNYVEIGYMIVEKEPTFKFFEKPECNFSSVIKSMAEAKQIGTWLQQDSYHSISDPLRLKKTEKYLKDKKIILIDRDGVINHKAHQGEYITSWKNFKIISDTFVAMKMLASKGFSFIIITNQAGIARSKMNYNDLNIIHDNLIDKLAKHGIEILKIYTCPHHWNDDCECRKPKPGMFYSASKDFYLRLDKTIFIGDDIRDCEAAFNAGVKSVFLGKSSELLALDDIKKPIFSSTKLLNILPNILDYFN